MNWKFSANVGFFGQRRDRFVEYQPPRSLAEKFELMAQVEGLSGIELKYPEDFKELSLVRYLLEEYHLELSAVNVDTKDATYFRHGAFAANNPQTRHHAISLLHEGMDMAAEFGAEVVSTCPAADGYDYVFQLDYLTAWGHFIETVRAVAGYRTDIKFCLEYQPHDPHAKLLLNNAGKILYVCAEVGLPNVGANLDIGHAFAALESPSETVALLAGKDRLFYLRTNDTTGDGGDWEMISGAVHFWDWLELLYTLRRVGYTGWLGGDITPKHIGPVEAYQTNTLMIQRMSQLLDRLGPDRITELLHREGNVAETFDYLSACLVAGSPGEVNQKQNLAGF